MRAQRRGKLILITEGRWTVSVVGFCGDVQVKVFRNGITVCEDCGVNVNCTHVRVLKKQAERIGAWK